MEKRIGRARLSVKQGNLVEEDVDAIVNAANSRLVPGGGVDGAIHAAGGPAIAEECRRITHRHGHLPTGEAVVTTAGNLRARNVIHTVGPVWYGGTSREEELLASAYRNSLRLAEERGLRTVSFPAISTGVFGYPAGDAARVALEAIAAHLGSGSSLAEVRVVLFDADNLAIWEHALEALPAAV